MNSVAYLIPRFILIGLTLCAVVIGSDPLAKFLVTQHLEKTTGVIVEVGRLRSRTSQAKIFINDLAVVDPSRPLQNLFQADMAYLELDNDRLLDRQCVIEHARASQVRLDVPRTVPVSAVDGHVDQSIAAATSGIRFLSNAEQARTAWMDQFTAKPVDIAKAKPEIKLYRVASATNARWNNDFQYQRRKIKFVKASFAKLASEAITPEEIERNGLGGPPNPLRKGSDRGQESNELEDVLLQLEQLQQLQRELEAKAAADLAKLDSTYQQDAADLVVDGEDEPTHVNPDTLSQLLLTQLQEQIAGEALEWFGSVRNKLPINSHHTPKPSGYRGQFIPVVGYQEAPSLVVKNLLFDGSGRFQQQHVNFAGEVSDITDVPSSFDQPVTFKLRAQGAQHFVVEGSIDRRASVGSDQMTITFPTLPLGPQTLGTESEMLITLGSNTSAHGQIKLQVDGDKLTGDMTLDFSNIAMLVERLHDVAGGKEVQVRLNHALATVQEFDSVATIGGTLDSPELKFKSSLGDEIADAIEEITQSKTSRNNLAQKDLVDQFYSTEVTQLKNNITVELNKLNQLIGIHVELAQKMRASMKTAKTRWPDMR